MVSLHWYRYTEVGQYEARLQHTFEMKVQLPLTASLERDS